MSGTIDSFDLQKAREKIVETIRSNDDSDRDKAATYLSMAAVAIGRIEELETYAPDHPDWSNDRTLVIGNELAEKWYKAYTKAQNSNNVRTRWLELSKERIQELEEHEQQTHKILGNILGMDDSLEENAAKAINRIQELHDLNYDLVQNGNSLRSRAQRAESANDRLKKALIEERAKYISSTTLLPGSESIHPGWKSLLPEASEQLHSEGLL